MKQILDGFLFGLGLLPVLLIYRWITDHFLDSIVGEEIAESWKVDHKLIKIHNVKIKVKKESVEILGEIENTSTKDCDYIQLDCDLLDSKGELLAHSTGFVSNLECNAKKGFSTYFEFDFKDIDLNSLEHRVSIAQTFITEE